MLAASTVNAATPIKRPEFGTFAPGAVGDATVLKLHEGRFEYVDVLRERLDGPQRLTSEGVVVGGRWWQPA